MQTKINSELLSLSELKKGYAEISNVMVNEIAGVHLEYIAAKTGFIKKVQSTKNFYMVLLSLKGKALLKIQNQNYELGSQYIARIPFNTTFEIEVDKNDEFSCLLICKQLNKGDLEEIAKEPKLHSSLYIKAFTDCLTYKEDIKSSKTINRMILPERLVPRFCMGTVETEGPDEVGAHEHPMLEQLFLGLPGCKCTVVANEDSILLKENILLHIPLGSMHSVNVDKGNELSYVWLDFFKTIEGQIYMNEQHEIEEESSEKNRS